MHSFIHHLLAITLITLTNCNSSKLENNKNIAFQNTQIKSNPKENSIVLGASQLELYLPKIKGKKIGILANPTTTIGNKHLVDSLLSLGIKIEKVFGPEHGFRGNASAGAKVTDEKDPATGIKIVSLYGKKRKPSADDLKDIDIMLFDIQDVGCRFYTYINVLRDVMEACAEFNKPLIILDRPNPNGYLVDGPVLDMNLKSGIGQFPIPIAHGMTIGEFAKMINGENWLPNNMKCKIEIIQLKNYNHNLTYELPIKPSPNLNSSASIILYPSICLFEGTNINLGRGTLKPFTQLGAPALKGKYKHTFTPKSIKGMAESPLHLDKMCYGILLGDKEALELQKSKKINIRWMQELYNAYPNKKDFFDKSLSNQIGDIDKLAGVKSFKEQIINNIPESEIRKSWEPNLTTYKTMRKKYLLYP
jgi:uncharacterized protein YbbC (DUF1343 family)